MTHVSTTPSKMFDAPSGGTAGRFWKVVVLVLVAESVAIAAFYGLEWNWLRAGVVASIKAILSAFGSSVQVSGLTLTVNGHSFAIDSYCTYIDLIICSLPLLWRVHRTIVANLVVLAAFAASVTVVNCGRVALAIFVTSHDGSWFWSHDGVDYVLWYPTLGLVVWFWSVSLRKLWADAKSARGKSNP